MALQLSNLTSAFAQNVYVAAPQFTNTVDTNLNLPSYSVNDLTSDVRNENVPELGNTVGNLEYEVKPAFDFFSSTGQSTGSLGFSQSQQSNNGNGFNFFVPASNTGQGSLGLSNPYEFTPTNFNEVEGSTLGLSGFPKTQKTSEVSEVPLPENLKALTVFSPPQLKSTPFTNAIVQQSFKELNTELSQGIGSTLGLSKTPPKLTLLQQYIKFQFGSIENFRKVLTENNMAAQPSLGLQVFNPLKFFASKPSGAIVIPQATVNTISNILSQVPPQFFTSSLVKTYENNFPLLLQNGDVPVGDIYVAPPPATFDNVGTYTPDYPRYFRPSPTPTPLPSVPSITNVGPDAIVPYGQSQENSLALSTALGFNQLPGPATLPSNTLGLSKGPGFFNRLSRPLPILNPTPSILPGPLGQNPAGPFSYPIRFRPSPTPTPNPTFTPINLNPGAVVPGGILGLSQPPGSLQLGPLIGESSVGTLGGPAGPIQLLPGPLGGPLGNVTFPPSLPINNTGSLGLSQSGRITNFTGPGAVGTLGGPAGPLITLPGPLGGPLGTVGNFTGRLPTAPNAAGEPSFNFGGIAVPLTFVAILLIAAFLKLKDNDYLRSMFTKKKNIIFVLCDRGIARATVRANWRLSTLRDAISVWNMNETVKIKNLENEYKTLDENEYLGEFLKREVINNYKASTNQKFLVFTIRAGKLVYFNLNDFEDLI